jgi:hypothetical protein
MNAIHIPARVAPCIYNLKVLKDAVRGYINLMALKDAVHGYINLTVLRDAVHGYILPHMPCLHTAYALLRLSLGFITAIDGLIHFLPEFSH